MRQFIADSYNSVMNAKYNPLRHIPNQNTRHVVTLFLMWMWCGIFATWTGAIFFLGASLFLHSILFFGVLVTLGTFEAAKRHDLHFGLSEQPITKVLLKDAVQDRPALSYTNKKEG